MIEEVFSRFARPISSAAALAVFLSVSLAVRGFVELAAGDPIAVERRVDEIARRKRALDEQSGDGDDGDGTPDREGWLARVRTGGRVLRSLDEVIQRSALDRGLSLALERADVTLRPAEFLAGVVLAACACGLAGMAILGAAGAVVLAAAGACAPFAWLRSRKARRVRQFEAQLADGLTMMGNSLRSGYSLLQAMDIVAREMPKPISAEFGRVVQEAGFNVPLEESFEALVKRIESDDLDLMVTAIIIQRQIGGNLAEVLDRISTTIRERMRLLGEVRTLTAQGRISGMVVAALPLVLCLILTLLKRDYMVPVFMHPLGRAMLGVALGMQVAGMLIVRRIVNVRV
jgi:tight adherence protein B